MTRGTIGTVVKARYSHAGGAAKPHLRYCVHRGDAWGNQQYREVWDRDGSLDKQQAYQRLDQAHPEDYVYRLMLSPHPNEQDADHQLDLRDWTRDVMDHLEQQSGQRVDWFAVAHEHPDHRHVHVVAVAEHRLNVDNFRTMREAGDRHVRERERQQEHSHNRDHALEQRPGRPHSPDRDVAHERERAGAPVQRSVELELGL